MPLSKIESRKRNGNYQIFEIEREISLSTLDFSLESETLVNAWLVETLPLQSALISLVTSGSTVTQFAVLTNSIRGLHTTFHVSSVFCVEMFIRRKL